MTLSHDETKKLLKLIMSAPANRARQILNYEPKQLKRGETEFYAGVIEHGSGMGFSSEQWFDFFSKIPNRLFRDEDRLMRKLSESQRERIPFS